MKLRLQYNSIRLRLKRSEFNLGLLRILYFRAKTQEKTSRKAKLAEAGVDSSRASRISQNFSAAIVLFCKGRGLSFKPDHFGAR
jgi:hypothetical protein